MKKKIGFIGTGNMAKAIINGLIKSKFDAQIFGYDINQNNYDFLKKNGVKCFESYGEVVKCSNVLVLAVKPQNMEEVLMDIKQIFDSNNVLVSIAAGINESYVSKILDKKIKFVQVMPNTPLLLQAGAVAMCKGNQTSIEEFDLVKQMFSKSAVVCEISSNKMNDIIAINGSSPAFIYLFAKGFFSFAKKRNINSDVVTKLFCATLVGSAKMIEKSGKSIDELIKDVSSPGGTTLAGLSVLNDYDLNKIVEQTCEKTVQRAQELSK